MDNNSSDAAVQRRVPKPEDFPIAGPNSLGGLGQRAFAWLIDASVTFLPAFLVSGLFFLPVDKDAEVGLLSPILPIPMLLSMVAVWVIYQIVAAHYFGSTLGMLAAGLRLARYADGAKPDLSQATLRAVLPGAFFAMPIQVIGAGWVVVYAAALYNPLRRGLQDQAGGTIVVRTR